MTDPEIWTALAGTFRELGWWQDRELAWHFKNGMRMRNGSPLDDLNACHEMEKVLQGAQWTCYLVELEKLCNTQVGCCRATPRQRCEAFLRTLNLWAETPT